MKMKGKYLLMECVDCGETYLGDNMCDGCKCNKCDGPAVGLGFMGKVLIRDIEEELNGMQNKISKAKSNGLIRGRNKQIDFLRTLSQCGVDLREQVIKTIEQQRKNIGSYIWCKYE